MLRGRFTRRASAARNETSRPAAQSRGSTLVGLGQALIGSGAALVRVRRRLDLDGSVERRQRSGEMTLAQVLLANQEADVRRGVVGYRAIRGIAKRFRATADVAQEAGKPRNAGLLALQPMQSDFVAANRLQE
jgi:hypothetical protein